MCWLYTAVNAGCCTGSGNCKVLADQGTGHPLLQGHELQDGCEHLNGQARDFGVVWGLQYNNHGRGSSTHQRLQKCRSVAEV